MSVSPTNGIEWRLKALEEFRRRVDDLKLDGLVERVEAVTTEVRAMKRALWGFAFAVLTAAVVFALTVLSKSGTI